MIDNKEDTDLEEESICMIAVCNTQEYEDGTYYDDVVRKGVPQCTPKELI